MMQMYVLPEEGNFTKESLIEFRKPCEILNIFMSSLMSRTRIHQPYLNEDVSARQKKQFFMDCDRMIDELIWYVMTNGLI